TTAPPAVMHCSPLALLTVPRLPTQSHAPYIAVSSRCVGIVQSTTGPATANHAAIPSQSILQLARNTLTGTTLGLGLAAFYILPAAYQRRYVQIAMAIIPSMRIQDNFLFQRIGDPAHDQVL